MLFIAQDLIDLQLFLIFQPGVLVECFFDLRNFLIIDLDVKQGVMLLKQGHGNVDFLTRYTPRGFATFNNLLGQVIPLLGLLLLTQKLRVGSCIHRLSLSL